MSLEITTDSRSERFRDVVAKAFVEILGRELQYGPWTVMLRSERQMLCVVMTGPDEAREEWAFSFDLSNGRGPAAIADELWQRFRTGGWWAKRRGVGVGR
jgi:hypothetical protein